MKKKIISTVLSATLMGSSLVSTSAKKMDVFNDLERQKEELLIKRNELENFKKNSLILTNAVNRKVEENNLKKQTELKKLEDLEPKFTKYDLTEEQLKQIAYICYMEQGSAKGAAAEASLMANLFELYGSRFGLGADGLYNYIKNSGWFAYSKERMNNYQEVNKELLRAVKLVLMEGIRTLPGYIDEHDCYIDIVSIENESNYNNIYDENSYIMDSTKINNKYGSSYTFYKFPDDNADVFGYTNIENKNKTECNYYNYERDILKR